MRIRMIGLVLCFTALSGVAFADTFSGYLNDVGNTALVGSPGALPGTPALFGDDFEIANNVALYSWTAASADTYTFESVGFATGGIDPYFTLFLGTGASATFVGSNYDIAFSTGGDFSLDFALAADTYTIAIGVFANMSFAENFGAGNLGDGFTGLGGPSFLGGRNPYYYELNVTGATTPPGVPEPFTLPLLATGLAGIAAMKRRFQR